MTPGRISAGSAVSTPDKSPAGAICRLNAVEDGEGRGFTLGGVEIFIVRRGQQVFAYENRCPHEGKRLDRLRNRFMTFDGAYIKCAHHGAVFRIDDGQGRGTPCVGQRLTPCHIKVIGDWIVSADRSCNQIMD